MVAEMEADGGLGKARSEIESRTTDAKQRQRADHEAVDAALHEQKTRIEAAIAAFQVEADRLRIGSESMLAGHRTVGPKPRARFGYRPVAGWGFQAQPVPTEPIYEPGYTIYRRRAVEGDYDVEQRVVLRTPARIALIDTRRHRGNGRVDVPQGILPFHVGESGWLEWSSVPRGVAARQVESIRHTSDWFVAQLAEYVEARR